MSADQPASARKPDAPAPAAPGKDAGTTAGQDRDSGTAAAAKGQHEAPARQPVTALTRQDHAAAVLAGPPGRPREAPSGSASPCDQQQPGKTAHTPPERRSPARDADAAGAKGRHDAPARQPTLALTRQDHAAAVLAGRPGRPREAPGGSASPGDQQQPGKTAEAPPEHRGPARDAGTAGAKGHDHDARKAGAGGRTETRQHGPGTVESQDQSRLPGPSSATEQATAAKPRTAPDGPRVGPADGNGKAPYGVTAHPDGKSGTARDGTPAQHAEAAPAGRHRVHDARQHGHHQPAVRHDSAQPSALHDRSDAWPPPKDDQDRARALYAHDFGASAVASNATVGRERGTNVIGDKPDKSPGDTSDLPPTGEELVETADEDAPHREKFRHQLYEAMEDIDDSLTDAAPAAQQILDQPPPTGHPGVMVDVPHLGPEFTPIATPSVVGMVELALVAGVIVERAVHWGRDKMIHNAEGAKG